MEIPERIKARYFRPVIAHPEGAVVHHGDCNVYTQKICTCGLLHDLLPVMSAGEIYPKFDEEYNAQSLALDRLRR